MYTIVLSVIAIVVSISGLGITVCLRRQDRRREDARWKVEREERQAEHKKVEFRYIANEREKRIQDAVNRFELKQKPNIQRRYAAMKAAFTALKDSNEIKEAIRRLDDYHPGRSASDTMLGPFHDVIMDSDVDTRLLFNAFIVEGGSVSNVAGTLSEVAPVLKGEIDGLEQLRKFEAELRSTDNRRNQEELNNFMNS